LNTCWQIWKLVGQFWSAMLIQKPKLTPGKSSTLNTTLGIMVMTILLG